MVARRLSHRVVAIGLLPPSSATWRPTQITHKFTRATALGLRFDCKACASLLALFGHRAWSPDALGRLRRLASRSRKGSNIGFNILALATPGSRQCSQIVLFEGNLA